MEKLLEHLKKRFSDLVPADFVQLAQGMEERELAQYQTLYRQADPSTAFYVINTGRVALLDSDARPHYTLTTGSVLGESEFFRQEPRRDTARADSDIRYWEMTAEAFRQILWEQPQIGLRLDRESIAQMSHYLQDKLAQIDILSDLPADILGHMARQFKAHSVQQGEALYRQGDSAQGLFLVDRGRFLYQGSAGDREIASGSLQGGSVLLRDSHYDHSLVAQEEGLYWMLSRGDFQRLSSAYPTLLRALDRSPLPTSARRQAPDPQQVGMLQQIPQLAGLALPVLEEMVSQSFARTLQAGDIVYRTGEPGDAFFLVLTGEIEISTSSTTGVNQELSRIKPGGIFGLESLLQDSLRTKQATATLQTDLRVIPREVLLRLGQTHAQVAQWMDSARLQAPPEPGPAGLQAPDLGDLSMFSVFAGLAGAELARFTPELGVANFYPQEQIYASGDTLDCLYLLQQGTVLLEQAGETVPRQVQPGQPLGLSYLMTQQSSREHAFASTDVRLITLDYEAVVRLTSAIPRFQENLWRVAMQPVPGNAEPPIPDQPPGPTGGGNTNWAQPVPALPVNPYGQTAAPAAPLPPPAPPRQSRPAAPAMEDDPFLTPEARPRRPGGNQGHISLAGKIRAILTVLALLWLLLAVGLLPRLPAEVMDFMTQLFPS